MSRYTLTDDASPTSPFQGVNDREIHREIDTADLFYDSAHTAPAKGFSKPPPFKSAFPSDLDASSPPDKVTRLMDEAPGGELGDAEECETCLSCKKAKRAAQSWVEVDEFACACEDKDSEGGGGGISLADVNRPNPHAEVGLGSQWSLASNPRGSGGANGFGIRSGSQGTADIWTGAPKH